MATKRFIKPFGEDGLRVPIPDSTAGNDVSYEKGYTEQYGFDPVTDPDAKFVELTEENQIFHDITSNLKLWQENVFPDFITAANNGGVAWEYKKGDTVLYNGENYESLEDNNTDLPTTEKWVIKKPNDVLRAILIGLGYSGNYGFFEKGFVYREVGDLGFSSDGVAYIYAGVDLLPVTVPPGTDPSVSVDYESVAFNDHSKDINRNAVGAHDDIYIRTVTSLELISENAPSGTRYLITDLDYARYDIVESTDSGGFYIEGLASGRKARLVDDRADKVSKYTSDKDGLTIRDDIISAIAAFGDKLTIPRGFKLRVSDVPTSLQLITGNGRLVWDNDATSLITYNMPVGFTVDNVEIETIYRNRLSFSASSMKLTAVREIMSDSRTDPARYNAVEWNGNGGSIDITSHRTFNTGLRALNAHLSASKLNLQMNNYGQGLGIDAGTDGIKTSQCLSQNIDDVKVFGCSRDVIDTFVGGGEANFSNFWADGFFTNGVEIKSEGTLAGDNNITPHDINLTNFNIGSGGGFSGDTFAALVIFNQNKGDYDNSPRKINVTNFNCRGIGIGAAGTYHGVRADGVFQLNLINSSILDAKDSGISATDCVDVNLSNSNIHGRSRGMSASSLVGFKASNSVIGYDKESDSRSSIGMTCSDLCSGFDLSGVDILGSSRSLSVENHVLNDFKMSGGHIKGAIRIDEFTGITFRDVDMDRESAPGGGDMFLSGGVTPSDKLKIFGGTIKNARFGVNQQSLNILTCIGVDFENVTSPFGGTVSNNNRRIIGCSTDSGSFPSASGDDYIEGNIIV